MNKDKIILGFHEKDNRNPAYSELWENRQYEHIIEIGNAALEKNPMDKTALVYTGFANFYHGISMVNLEEKEAYIDQTVFLLRKALLTDGKINTNVKYVLGKAYVHKGHFYSNLAVKYLSQAVDEGYHSIDIYEYLGLAYTEQDDYADGILYFKQAVQAGNDSELLYLALAQAYMNSGDYQQACDNLVVIAEKTENNELAEKSMSLLGNIYLKNKNYAQAKIWYTKVLELNNRSVDTYYHLGEIYEAEGDISRAKSMWRRAYNLDPSHYNTKIKLFG